MNRNALERLAEGFSHWVERRLTPKDQRAALEYDFLRRKMAAQIEQVSGDQNSASPDVDPRMIFSPIIGSLDPSDTILAASSYYKRLAVENLTKSTVKNP